MNKVNYTLFIHDFFNIMTCSQEVFKMMSMCTHACCQSLSSLIDYRINNILLQTAWYQLGTDAAHWHNKTYCCSF